MDKLALVLAVALAGCGRGGLDEAAALLAVPPGGVLERAAGPAPRLERVETALCYPGRRAVDLAADVELTLRAAGWRDVAVRANPDIAGRENVTAARDGLALAGIVEEGASGCDGARLRLGAHVPPPLAPGGAGSRAAGPAGPRRATSRVPMQ